LACLEVLRRGWQEINPSDELRQLAIQLLDTHALRAADSLQLAAALTWCDERPTRRPFLCADHRLSEAARSEGFSVLELSRHVV
jgi:predicted nucleic acid-binding protein